VYLPQEGRGIGLAEKIKAYGLQDKGMDTVEANMALGHKADMRDYGVGLQILKDLGLKQVRLLTNNPKKTEAFNLRGLNLTSTMRSTWRPNETKWGINCRSSFNVSGDLVSLSPCGTLIEPTFRQAYSDIAF